MKPCHLFRITIAGVIGIFVCSCAELPPQVQRPLNAVLPTPIRPSGWWNDDGVSGPPRIVVHIGEQKAYFYKGSHLVGQSTVSTGKPGFSTPPGRYKVVSKDKDHVSTVFGDYIDDAGNVIRFNIDKRSEERRVGK